ncbi:enoyl-ACP reductase FabI [Leptospira terpstrae]|uniref:Enoyl-[acyl-carrier-protein] reductase [NADH] n=1 Tax=Leptospira terpstrae serovar Hualin str. LT 11-33 = ATCC 700639 TaxID=1257025 RepID=N1VXK5_9LEPT|nr:SDR family oxidoreductase [Leptospira terpstrae]EMY63248.1 enoyl-(Acyl carrier protein) reductase [Leptospira terpstrae serovar Hualin str. LT 11-33 = ATCC 700639]
MNFNLEGRSVIITGITDSSSLALVIAKECKQLGAKLICTGLGKTEFHQNLSEAGLSFLERTYSDFTETVKRELGDDVITYPLDVTIQKNIDSFAEFLLNQGLQIHSVLHSIAMDKTIRQGKVKPIMTVSREEFMDAMNVSAFSLLALIQSFYQRNLLVQGGSIVALSYLGAERVVSHPYKNIGVAKSALERLVKEMAMELGKEKQIQVNAIRFSPYRASKAGSAIEGLEQAEKSCDTLAPLGNASAKDLAEEVAYLFRPGNRITGEIRHVDGGYHIRG